MSFLFWWKCNWASEIDVSRLESRINRVVCSGSDMCLLFLIGFEFGSKSVAFIGKMLFGKISTQSCTGRASHQLKWRFVPGLLARAVQGCTVGRARPLIFVWVLVVGAARAALVCTGRVSSLLFEFLKNYFGRIFWTVTPIVSPFEAGWSLEHVLSSRGRLESHRWFYLGIGLEIGRLFHWFSVWNCVIGMSFDWLDNCDINVMLLCRLYVVSNCVWSIGFVSGILSVKYIVWFWLSMYVW